MKMKKLFLTALFAAAALRLAAQAPAESPVFAPFVSRLAGELKNNLVRLSWIDSRDARGPVYLYRSDFPFESSALPETRPVEIPYGTQYYVDEIEAGRKLYYFAVASDGDGNRYSIPIHYTNTISVGAGEAATAPAPSGGTGISGLEAQSRGDRVVISFDSGGVQNAALYRSSRPITRTQDLLSAVIVQSGVNSPFTDSPAPGIPYYYAVIAGEDLARGTVEINPGRNSTAAPVETSAGRADGGTDLSARSIRAMPLPELSVQAAVPGMESPPPPTALSPEAAGALSGIPARPRPSPVMKKPRVFSIDMETSPAAGGGYALSPIVQGPFAAREWANAREQLTDFLALPRDPGTQARARFYLGQCCYFLRQPRDGLFEFLAIQDRYPRESAEWIQASLEMMKE